VLCLDTLVATFQPIEPIPEVGAEPFSPLFFRRTHGPHLFACSIGTGGDLSRGLLQMRFKVAMSFAELPMIASPEDGHFD
jgi:hypothetical protein